MTIDEILNPKDTTRTIRLAIKSVRDKRVKAGVDSQKFYILFLNLIERDLIERLEQACIEREEELKEGDRFLYSGDVQEAFNKACVEAGRDPEQTYAILYGCDCLNHFQ
jgi:hypothetical protein